VHVVHNWSWDEVSATPPGALSDVLAGEAPVTGALTLGPWDVRVLVNTNTSTSVNARIGEALDD
jgi:hypothetical protein